MKIHVAKMKPMGLFDKIKNLFSGKDTVETTEPSAEIVAEVKAVYDHVTLSAAQAGRKHLNKEIACWDYVRTTEAEKLRITVLADGGKESAVRGDRGAQMACVAAEQVLRAFGSSADLSVMDERKRYEAFLQLAKEILVAWKQAVAADLAQDPLEDGEAAYDTELICALCTPEYLLVLRNGQGSCVVFDENAGPFSVFARTRKKESMGDGLSGKNAMMNFRFHYSEALPMAVWLHSDGFDRAYSKTEDLHAADARLSLAAAENGADGCKMALEELLQSLSENKNSDDLSSAAILSKTLANKNKVVLTNHLEHHEFWSRAEETRRQLARVMRLLKEKQTMLKTTLERLEVNRAELAEMNSELWSIPGLELSTVEMDALQDGIQAQEEKISILHREIEALQTERTQLNTQLEELTTQMTRLKGHTEEKGETK